MRTLVTGTTGFVGRHFVRHLHEMGVESFALALDGQRVDLRDEDGIRDAISCIQPDAVVHLAGQTSVAQSIHSPLESIEVNFLGTHNLLNGLKRANFDGRLLFVSSSEVYGAISPHLLPATEDLPLKPKSPYALSKVGAEALCHQWASVERMDIVIARPFNHFGAGQDTRFVLPAFAKQVAEAVHGLRPPVISVGDISVSRDFTDVRDVVHAYYLLLKKGQTGEVYNVCSEKGYLIRSLLEELISASKMEIEVRQDPKKMRPNEQRAVIGSCAKLVGATKWQPKIAIEEGLSGLLEYWLENMEGETRNTAFPSVELGARVQ